MLIELDVFLWRSKLLVVVLSPSLIFLFLLLIKVVRVWKLFLGKIFISLELMMFEFLFRLVEEIGIYLRRLRGKNLSTMLVFGAIVVTNIRLLVLWVFTRSQIFLDSFAIIPVLIVLELLGWELIWKFSLCKFIVIGLGLFLLVFKTLMSFKLGFKRLILKTLSSMLSSMTSCLSLSPAKMLFSFLFVWFMRILVRGFNHLAHCLGGLKRFRLRTHGFSFLRNLCGRFLLLSFFIFIGSSFFLFFQILFGERVPLRDEGVLGFL